MDEIPRPDVDAEGQGQSLVSQLLPASCQPPAPFRTPPTHIHTNSKRGMQTSKGLI